MKTIAIQLNIFTNQYYKKNATKSVFELLAHELGISHVVVDKTEGELLPYLYQLSDGYDYLMIGYEDSEFYNLEENKRLWEKILKYDVDIGFGDNYPEGIIAQFVRRETLPVLENIRKQNDIAENRSCLEKVIAVDVNTFDLENHYAEVSLRTLRLSLFANNLQDQFTIAKVKNFFTNYSLNFFLYIDYITFAETVLKNRHSLRTIPKYYEISITERQLQSYRYCPVSFDSTQSTKQIDMSIADFKLILQKIIDFSHNPIIALAGFGETTAHPDWKDYVEAVLNAGCECIVETSGVLWTKEVSEHWLKHLNKNLLNIVFKIEAVDKNLYQQIRGNEFELESILENIEYFLIRNPEKTHIETVKTTETFKHLPDFHNYFSKYTKNIIIGKYNPYRGTLPELRINPMKPYEQIDCWHLKLDGKVDVEGNVWLCKQDFKREHVLGNLIKESMRKIHEQGQKYFEQHVVGWEFCKNCDEFYGFNF